MYWEREEAGGFSSGERGGGFTLPSAPSSPPPPSSHHLPPPLPYPTPHWIGRAVCHLPPAISHLAIMLFCFFTFCSQICYFFICFFPCFPLTLFCSVPVFLCDSFTLIHFAIGFNEFGYNYFPCDPFDPSSVCLSVKYEGMIISEQYTNHINTNTVCAVQHDNN